MSSGGGLQLSLDQLEAQGMSGVKHKYNALSKRLQYLRSLYKGRMKKQLLAEDPTGLCILFAGSV